jgi:D-arabinose 1-dehydrogenase-like Zn-dependent alcohol dehydrogenase
VDGQQPAEFTEVEVRRPGPDVVLVKVAGVGLCHTDLLFLGVAERAFR